MSGFDNFVNDPEKMSMLFGGINMMAAAQGGRRNLNEQGLGYGLMQGLKGGAQGYQMGTQYKDKALKDEQKTNLLGLLETQAPESVDGAPAVGPTRPGLLDDNPMGKELAKGMIAGGDYGQAATMMLDYDKNQKQFGSGQFQGTGQTAQNMNALMNLDPSDPMYAMAYANYTTPRMTPTANGPVWVTPQLPPNIKPPASNGMRSPMPSAGNQANSPINAIKGMEKISPDQKQYNSAFAESSKLVDAYNRYVENVQNIVPENASDWINVSGADVAKLNSSYKNMALAAKGPNLFALGVLAGPDMDMIEGAMLDPTSFEGNFLGKAAMLSSVAETGKGLKSSLSALSGQFEGGSVKFKDMPKFTDFETSTPKTKGAPETQVIGGVTYVKTPDGWEAQ